MLGRYRSVDDQVLHIYILRSDIYELCQVGERRIMFIYVTLAILYAHYPDACTSTFTLTWPDWK